MDNPRRHSGGSGRVANRRLHLRRGLSSLAYVELNEDNRGLAFNLGEGGLGVQSSTVLVEKSLPRISFQLPQSGKLVKLNGKIAWIGESQKDAGIQFIDLPETARIEIGDWVSAGPQQFGHYQDAEVVRPMRIREMIRAHTTAGVRRAYWTLRSEIQIQYRHFSSVRKAKRLSTATELKLNLGCGPNIRPGWINVDSHYSQADLQLDLRERLPFRDGSASIVYSEHFFEHLEYPDQAMEFLRESWRVLMPGGILSVGVPDTEWPIMSYANGDPEYFRLARERFHPKWCDTRMHNLNYHFRQGTEHKYAYDFETLAKILKEVGFVCIKRRSFKAGLDSEDHMVSSLPRGTASLYVDARKPDST